MADFILDQVAEITQELKTLLGFEWTLYKPIPEDKTLLSKWENLVLKESMKTATSKLRWLGATDKLRPMKDEAKFYQFKEYDYSIDAEKYQTGIVLSVDDIEDNIEQDYMSKVQSVVGNAKRLPPELVHYLILNGTTLLGYDGVAFFSNTHPCGMSATTFDNLQAGTLSETTLALAREVMLQFPNDRGEIVGYYPDTIVVPPRLQITAEKIVNSTYTTAVSTSEGANTVNTMYKAWNVIVDPWLTDVDDWYVTCSNAIGIRPFIFLERYAPRFEYDDTERVTRDILKWSLKYRCGIGYGFPQTAIKFVN